MDENFSSSPYVPTQEAKDLHAKHVAQAWADQQASTDAFDNNLLTFSSAALGLSVAFIKDIVPLVCAQWLMGLYLSWISFACCIVITVASFQIAAQANRVHANFLGEYYLRGDTLALNKKSSWSKSLPWCSALGSFFLLLGITSTLVFASKNVSHFRKDKTCQTMIPITK